MKDPNETVFTRATLKAAMATNCSYYHGMSVEERFKLETNAVIGGLDSILRDAGTVVDFGMGVGRVTKSILDTYPTVKVVGVDNSENMLQHVREYVPRKYFDEGRLRCMTTDGMRDIPDGSVDLIMGIYVLQHVHSGILPHVLDEWERVLKDDGKVYVLNCKSRAVPRPDRLERYNRLRRLFRFLEHNCDYKQIQRLSIKLDNKCLFRNDGIDVEKELSERFTPEHDVLLGCSQHMQRLMRNHFSRIYTKRKS